MKSILSLVGMAIALDNYAKSLEVESDELDIAGFNVKRASLFLQKLQNDFTDSIVPSIDNAEDANVLDFGIKISELKEDIEAHVKSLDVANPNYARLINNALSAIEEAELWFDEHVKSVIKDVVQNIDSEDSDPIKTEMPASEITESLSLVKDEGKVEGISNITETKEVVQEETMQPKKSKRLSK